MDELSMEQQGAKSVLLELMRDEDADAHFRLHIINEVADPDCARYFSADDRQEAMALAIEMMSDETLDNSDRRYAASIVLHPEGVPQAIPQYYKDQDAAYQKMTEAVLGELREIKTLQSRVAEILSERVVVQ
jgi:hypothetical protein